MFRSRRSTRQSRADGGFSHLELLIGITLTGLAMAATSGFFLASNNQMRQQSRRTETDQAARSAVDMIIRDLRLGGACLPVTGTFISLEGQDSGDQDEIVTRTGLVRPDLSCIRTALRATTSSGTTTVRAESVDGFTAGMRAYIRKPTGVGEYFDIASVDVANDNLESTAPFGRDYEQESGLYAIDERKFYLGSFTSPRGVLPELMMKIGDDPPISFAVGIQELGFEYQLRRNCPPCDVVDLPSTNAEWAIVEQIYVTVKAQAEEPDLDGQYYSRTVRVGVKPRNMLPR